MKRKKSTTRDLLISIIVSLVVSIVIILPELSLFFGDDELFEQIYHGTISNVLLEGVTSFIIMMILFVANFAIFKFGDPLIRAGSLKLVLSFLFIYVGALMLREISEEIIFWGYTKEDMGSKIIVYHMTHSLRDFIITIIVFLTSYGAYLIRKQHLTAMENQQLQTENAKSQYESLKNQLNPHMLFNSLNTLSTLVDESSEKAKDYIHELSSVLRYTLQESGKRKVCLEQEIEYSNAYIFLQKMRYEGNLNFTIEISGSAMNKQVPPMSLQLLIENAIKHNRISSKSPLIIDIHTEDDEWLVVSNIIQPKFNIKNANATCIGLENLNKRYELLFHREIIVERENDVFTVRIPLIESDKSIET